MADIYDVVVVGGGPSGSVAAKTLAGAGMKVSLVEKDFQRVKPCGGLTPSRSFEEFGLPEKVISRKIKSVSAISPSGFRINTLLDSGYLAMVERGVFDHSLRKQAEEAGADLTEAEFKALERRRGKVDITIMERGKARDISADFLVAADGVNSRVARAAGLESLPGVYTIQEEVEVGGIEDFKEPDSCEFWFGTSHSEDFYSWVFPKKDYIDIGTGSIHGRHLKGLMKKFKMRRRINGTGKQRIYREPIKWRDTLVRRNILFTGDAAGLVMPFSYEGIYYALKSGKMAADAIIKNNPKDYEKQWNRTFRRQFRLMTRLKKYFFKNDKAMEHMFKLYKRKQLQDISMRILFEKDASLSSFFSYFNFFKKFLHPTGRL